MQYITDKLHDDHDKVEGIFKKLKETTDGAEKTRQDLCQKLKDELLAHAEFEEAEFYPALRAKEGADDLIDEALDEHQKIKDMLGEIEQMDVTSAAFSDKVSELETCVQHHVKEEENEIFPIAKDAIEREEGEQMTRTHDRMVQEHMQQAAR